MAALARIAPQPSPIIMEFPLHKREGTKNNAGFFNSMRRNETKLVSRVM